jgi:excisionase family DNA binding protein
VPKTEFSLQEIRDIANTVAEILMPQIAEVIKGKAKWTVSELSSLSGEYMSVKELSFLFKVSERHIRDMIDEGMPHVRVGQAIRIEKSIIRQAIKDGRL